MHKVQQRTLKKRKDNYTRNERNGGKTIKIDGRINTSKRLTIPPDFFRVGITTPTNQKTLSKTSKENEESYVLENVHGLFNNCLNVRRSERILNKYSKKRSLENYDAIDESKSNSFNEVIYEHLHKSLKLNAYQEEKPAEHSNSQNLKEQPLSKYRDNFTSQDIKGKRSKSIFEEINQLYVRSSQSSDEQINKNRFSINETDPNSKFCSSLLKQVKVNFKQGQKSTLTCKSRIFREVEKIENLLSGRTEMETTNVSNNIPSRYYPEESGQDIQWEYFSQSDWIFETPPRQRINLPKVQGTQLQPAVMCSTQKQSQLFEWKPDVKVDVCDFDTKNDIVVDYKFMEHIATLKREVYQDIEMEPVSNPSSMKTMNSISMLSQSVSQVCDNVFKFPKPNLIENNLLTNIFSRPTKKSSTSIKAKRKLEGFGEENFPNERHINKENIDPCFGFDAKKKLFTSNGNTKYSIDFSDRFKFDRPDMSSRNETAGNFDKDFSFLQSNTLENVSNLSFGFNNPKNNAFDFNSNAANFIL